MEVPFVRLTYWRQRVFSGWWGHASGQVGQHSPHHKMHLASNEASFLHQSRLCSSCQNTHTVLRPFLSKSVESLRITITVACQSNMLAIRGVIIACTHPTQTTQVPLESQFILAALLSVSQR